MAADMQTCYLSIILDLADLLHYIRNISRTQGVCQMISIFLDLLKLICNCQVS